ncbi:ATP-dependent DNA helicase [Microbacterium sp. AK031]|uniref:ATP-dependent helicase n=1 Tax=Microbacterium sp. AK031 TaxID=2723076 RepID=UPI00216861D9|nr:ATP-dependent DNA helicase [Microbacterium sp. AK031]MCS3842059.1 superfamily I DNA/RNA helicase [Microbacterium sp. AK031]
MTEDAGQRAVVDAVVEASGVIIGAPGTGKTQTLIDRVAVLLGAHALAPEEVLVLTPNRQAATVLRDRIGVRIGQATPGPLARSLGSFAFQLVRGAMVHAGEEPPALLTGADQDRIIADLLAGDVEDEAAGRPSRWPESLSAGVRASKGFRSELRAFLAECTELGVQPRELQASERPVWRAVGAFIDEYRAVLGGMRTAYRDAADLVSEAAAILRDADAAVLGPLAPLRVVLIDDAQEITRGGITMVRALRARGIAVLAFGDPDISSGAFRGASPQLFHDLSGVLERVFVLETPHRQKRALTDLTRTVTQAIGVAGRVEHRRAPGPAAEIPTPAVPFDAPVQAFLAPSPYEEADRIAGTLRDWHLTHGIAWSDMAVIAHDTRQVTSLETELAAREVPTRAAGVQRPLGSEGVVRDIVGIVRLALTPVEDREPEMLIDALRSPFGGMDAVGLRRLRARLRHVELADGGSTPASELFRQAMAFPAHFTFVDAPEARVASRFATTLAETAAAADAGETIHELLWRIWDNARALDGSKLQQYWRAASEQPGGGETARALDALVALFDAAKRFVERTPNERPEVFVRDILDSEVPEDTLSTPERPGLVTLLTPATALGTQFDAVIVAGVQDGVWPNVRLRGGLLETWRLADAVIAARTGEPETAPGVLDRRRDALHDELRLFVRALSRARSRIVVTAVDDDATGPSPFFSFLPDPPPASAHPAAEHPLTLRGLVARHRRTLTSSIDPDTRADAAGQLSVLAHEGIPGADPGEWYGVAAPSTSAPLHDLSTGAARVSPSKMESFEECELNWAIAALGGDTVLPPSAGMGTIIHEAMETVPDGDLEKLRAVVAEHWPELDFETEWIGRKERRRADLYIERLHSYIWEVSSDRGRVLASEVEFRFAVDVAAADEARSAEDDSAAVPAVHVGDEVHGPHRAVVHGFIDRVEAYPSGAGEHAAARGRGWTGMAEGLSGECVVVVDLKTGKNEPTTDAKCEEHAQLAAYQVAVQQGLIDGADAGALAGARLLLVANTLSGSDYRVAHQHTLEGEARSRFLKRLASAARGMSGDRFTAHVEAHCADVQWRVHPCRIHTVPAVSA